jgi:hypothetical protein
MVQWQKDDQQGKTKEIQRKTSSIWHTFLEDI